MAQEAQRAGPQTRQVLRLEVVRQVAVVSAEARRRMTRLLAVADREGGEVDRSRPPLALLDQLLGTSLAERDAGSAQEELCLALAQCQRVRPELEQLSACAQ